MLISPINVGLDMSPNCLRKVIAKLLLAGDKNAVWGRQTTFLAIGALRAKGMLPFCIHELV